MIRGTRRTGYTQCGIHMGAAAILVLAMGAFCPADGEVRPYPVMIGEPTEAYGVRVNGQELPVHTFWKGRAGVMARFAFDGEATVSIRPEGGNVAGYEVRPWWAKVDASVEDGALQIRLTQPQDLYIRVNKGPALHLFSYPLFEAPTDEGVRNAVDDFGLDASGETDTSDALQKAVDAVADAGGGTLLLPDGTYAGADDATVRLKSNVRLHLAPGALLSQTRLLIQDAENVTVSGHGMIDFTGSPGGNQAGCLRAIGVKNLTIREVISTNFDYNWNTRFDFCQDVTVRRYRIFGGKDGIDPVDSQRVSIRDVQIVTVDDCIATKSFRHRRERKAVEKITAENCMLRCLRYGGVKIGTETNAPAFRDITYRNIDLIAAERAAIIQLRDGAEVHDILIENLVCDLGWGRAIDFVIQKRNGLGTIHDVTVRNVNLRNLGDDAPRLAGYDEEHPVRDVTFEGLVIEGEAIGSAADSGFEREHTEDIRFLLPKKHGRPIAGLGERVTERSDDWQVAIGGGLAAVFDGEPASVGGVRDSDLASFVLDLGQAKTLQGIRCNGAGDGNAVGVSVLYKSEDGWQRLVDHRLVRGGGWTEAAFEPVEARKVKIVLHGMPGNDNCVLGELQLLEQVEL